MSDSGPLERPEPVAPARPDPGTVVAAGAPDGVRREPPGSRRLDGWLRGFRTDMGRWTEFYRGPEARTIPHWQAE